MTQRSASGAPSGAERAYTPAPGGRNSLATLVWCRRPSPVFRDRHGVEELPPLGHVDEAARGLAVRRKARDIFPSNRTRPPHGRMLPAIARNAVVLPTPFAPMIVVSWPLDAPSEIPHSTCTSPYPASSISFVHATDWLQIYSQGADCDA